MFTAQQARELSDLSEKTIEGYVKLALVQVKSAAELGVREKAMYCLPWSAKAGYEQEKPTKVQDKIMDKLKELGYNVSFERDENGYIPRGLEEDAPFHYNEVIVVRW